MKSGIYEITNIVSGKKYIGSSVNIKKRWKEHKYELKNNIHPNQHLQNSYNKHGVDVFIFKKIESVEPCFLIKREQYYIDKYDFKSLYNIAPNAGSPLGIKVSEKTKKKLSKLITFKGETHSVKEWSEKTGLSHATMSARFRNWPIERAITEKSNAIKKSEESVRAVSKYIKFNGETLKISDWARKLNIHLSSLRERLERWPLEKALTTEKITISNLNGKTGINNPISKMITFMGETKNISEWANTLNISVSTLLERMDKWPLERALTEPKNKIRTLTFNGETKRVSEWSKETGISVSVINSRLRKNWPIKDVLTKPPNNKDKNNPMFGKSGKKSPRSRLICFNNKTQNLSDWAKELGISTETLRERLDKWTITRALTTPKIK